MRLKLLAVLPFILLTSCSINDDFKYESEGYQKLEIGNTCQIDDVKNVDIDWVNGSIFVNETENDYISFYETQAEVPLYYKVDNATLYIKLAKSGMPARIINRLEKSLYIDLPIDTNNINMKTVDTYVNLNPSTNVNEVSINSVNGYYNIPKMFAHILNISAVNTSYFTRLYPYPEEIFTVNLDLVNADIEIGYKGECGYAVNWSGINSTFESALDEYKIGQEQLKINFDGVNSRLYVFQAS